MMPLYYDTLSSPIGEMVLTTTGLALNGLTLGDSPPDGAVRDRARLKPYVDEVREYLAGERQVFSFRVDQPGTNFQTRVWKELMNIPFGETISYAELARRIGQPTASRAVGSANGKNQIAIVVPCHRVIASGGNLGGYGGGLWRKEWLLNLESRL
jgi:methylated-DNA-[protein]-cysteine S-methyltransferase